MPESKEVHETKLAEDVALAIGGDRDALTRVVRAVEPLVSRLALRFFGCPAHAADGTQEVLVQIVTKLDRFRGQSAFSTWVYRVATNKFLSMSRSRAEQAALSFEDFDAELVEPGGPEADIPLDVEQELLLAEVRVGCTLAMLLCLDRPARMAYIFGAILELDHETASELLGTSSATYRKRLERSRQSVTSLMKDRCGVFDARNACSCRGRVPIAIRRSRLDPQNLLFAPPFEQARLYPEVLNGIRQLEEAQRAVAVFRSHPDPKTRGNFAERLHDLLAAVPGLVS